MYFYAHTMGIKFDPDMVPELLQKAREIYDKSVPPDPAINCKDCRMQLIYQLILIIVFKVIFKV